MIHRQIFWLRVAGRVALLVIVILSCNLAYQWHQKPILDPASQLKISGSLESLTEESSTIRSTKYLAIRIVGDENTYIVSKNIWPERLPEGRRVLTEVKPGAKVTVILDGRIEFSSQRRVVIGLASEGREWFSPEDHEKWIRNNRIPLVLILTVLALGACLCGWYQYPIAERLKADRRAVRIYAFFWVTARISTPALAVVLVYFGLENFRALQAKNLPLEKGTIVERSNERFAFIIPSYKLTIEDGEKRLIVQGSKHDLSGAPDEIEFQRISDSEAYIPSLQSPPLWIFVFLLLWGPVHLWITHLGKLMHERAIEALDIAVRESERLERTKKQQAQKLTTLRKRRNWHHGDEYEK